MNTNALNWIVGRDTGISSRTIWAVMMGAVTEPQQCDGSQFDIPHDADDFGRCHRLLELVPFWRQGLKEVANIFPKWKPFVREWNSLTKLYIESREKLYDRMKELEEEAMVADGWQRTSPHSWKRGKAQSVRVGASTISSGA